MNTVTNLLQQIPAAWRKRVYAALAFVAAAGGLLLACGVHSVDGVSVEAVLAALGITAAGTHTTAAVNVKAKKR